MSSQGVHTGSAHAVSHPQAASQAPGAARADRAPAARGHRAADGATAPASPNSASTGWRPRPGSRAPASTSTSRTRATCCAGWPARCSPISPTAPTAGGAWRGDTIPTTSAPPSPASSPATGVINRCSSHSTRWPATTRRSAATYRELLTGDLADGSPGSSRTVRPTAPSAGSCPRPPRPAR